MVQQELPEKIGTLVDYLRTHQDPDISLTDVASVTEILIGTMQAYFRSIDTTIYTECRSLSEYISNARVEIASLTPTDLEGERIPRAGMELDAIVAQTETATNTIMESAETIMNCLGEEDVAAQADTMQDAVMEIFQACSFQDITGQRISKVVSTLQHIEKRVQDLRSLLGITDDDIDKAKARDEEEDTKDSLLSGPALEGEGIDQNEVDELLGNKKSSDDGAEAGADSEDSSASEKDKKAKKEKDAKLAAMEDSNDGGETSQDDIDALFD